MNGYVLFSSNVVYMAAGNAGLQIINVGDASKPHRIGSYDTPGDAQDMVMAGGYVFLADGPGGLQIVNVNDPTEPHLAGSFALSGDAYGLDVRSNYVYIAHRNPGGSPDGIPAEAQYFLSILDVTNPAQPKLAGRFNADYYPLERVAISVSYAYVTGRGLLRTFDLRNPASPADLGITYMSPWQSEKIYASGGKLYIATGDSGLKIFDIAEQPALPKRVGGCRTAAYSVAVSADCVYVAAGAGGLKIWRYDVWGG